jgi:5-methylcytosine-specific restriction endonuclease McrA
VALQRYLAVLRRIRAERGEICECCGRPAKHGHHIIGVSEMGLASELVYEPSNIMLLCDDCHSLMHPNDRRISDWGRARKDRWRRISRRT